RRTMLRRSCCSVVVLTTSLYWSRLRSSTVGPKLVQPASSVAIRSAMGMGSLSRGRVEDRPSLWTRHDDRMPPLLTFRGFTSPVIESSSTSSTSSQKDDGRFISAQSSAGSVRRVRFTTTTYRRGRMHIIRARLVSSLLLVSLCTVSALPAYADRGC